MLQSFLILFLIICFESLFLWVGMQIAGIKGWVTAPYFGDALLSMAFGIPILILFVSIAIIGRSK